MKKIIFTMYVFLLLFPSCIEKKVSSDSRGSEVCFSLTEETRAYTWQFVAGDRIGIYAVERVNGSSGKLRSIGNYADNKCFTFSGRGFVASSINDKIFTSPSGLDFYAYYPYKPSVKDASNMVFTVVTNQEQDMHFMAHDVLLARSSPSAFQSIIPLSFSHQLALLRVTFNLGKGKKCSGARVLSVSTSTKVDLSTLSTGMTLSRVGDIEMYRDVMTPSFVVFQALVPAQSFNKGSELFSFTVDGEEKIYTATENMKWLAGTRNTFNVSLQYRIHAHSASGGTVTGGGIYDCGTSLTLKATAQVGNQFEGWYEGGNKVSSDADYTFEVDSDRALMAKFIPQTFSVRAFPTVGGTTVGGGEIGYGSSCTLTVMEHPAYTFTGWYENGSLFTMNPEFTVQVYSDRKFEARFTPDDVYVDPRLLRSGYLFGTLGSACAHLFYKKNSQKIPYTPEYDLTIAISFKCLLREQNGAKTEKSYRKVSLGISKGSTTNHWKLFGWDGAMLSGLELDSYTGLYHLSLNRDKDKSARRYLIDDTSISVCTDGHTGGGDDVFESLMLNQRTDNF